jgi:hypothetical protein
VRLCINYTLYVVRRAVCECVSLLLSSLSLSLCARARACVCSYNNFANQSTSHPLPLILFPPSLSSLLPLSLLSPSLALSRPLSPSLPPSLPHSLALPHRHTPAHASAHPRTHTLTHITCAHILPLVILRSLRTANTILICRWVGGREGGREG